MAENIPDWAKETPAVPDWAKEEEPSQTAAFFKSAAEAVPEALGAAGGMKVGALAGAPFGPVGSFVGGLGGAVLGGVAAGKAGEKIAEQIPAKAKEAVGFGEKERAAEKGEYPITSAVGRIAPDVAAITPGAAKAGKYVVGLFKTPAPVAQVKDLAEVGEKGFDLLKKRAENLYEARRVEARQKYTDAFDAARRSQAKGEPFATSPQGRTLLSELERDKKVIAGNQPFEVGAEKIAGIDRLINAIKGTTTGGQKVPVGKGVVSKTMTKTTPTKTTEKDIEALVEELRFLRDVDAKGQPYQAYASLSAEYKRDLVRKLEKQLYGWSDEYRLADEAYKAASDKLAPFQTRLMSGALKGEKFNAKDLIKSPEDFGRTFFSDVNGVRNLKEATQSPGEVASLGKEYIASLFANKSPADLQKFVKDTSNTGWLKEAGIYDDVVNYANKATTAQSRQQILKNIVKGASYAGGALTVGAPVYYGIRRSMGF